MWRVEPRCRNLALHVLFSIHGWPVSAYGRSRVFVTICFFYRVMGDELQVLRVLHAAQDYTRFFREDADRC